MDSCTTTFTTSVFVRAPNNGNTKNACIASALGSGALSIGIDALGFIPGEKDVEAGVKIGAGTVARRIGIGGRDVLLCPAAQPIDMTEVARNLTLTARK